MLSDARESMNRVKKVVFLVRKWSYTTFNIVKIRKIWEKKGKIRKTWSITKKTRSSEIFAVKMEIFSEKNTSFRNLGPRKSFPSPRNSAPGLLHWSESSSYYVEEPELSNVVMYTITIIFAENYSLA